MEIVFATQNEHKIIEIRKILGESYKIISLSDIGHFDELEENHDNMEMNALQKARFIYQNYQKNCFADDSGMEIDALNGRPGVNSARYAGLDKDMNANIEKILQEMKGNPDRKAQFRTVIALVLDGKEFLFDGVIKGSIINEKRGNNGFGYDPIFIPEGYNQTFAEMTLEEKNKISHRAKAVEQLKAFKMPF
jgi:XTP/dITP diphosphohydrolase